MATRRRGAGNHCVPAPSDRQDRRPPRRTARRAPTGADPDARCSCRRIGGRPRGDLLTTGVGRFDAALGGGLPGAGLTEIHARGDARRRRRGGLRPGACPPAAWQSDVRCPSSGSARPRAFARPAIPIRRASRAFRHRPGDVCWSREADRLADALWIAEEAARLDGFAGRPPRDARQSAPPRPDGDAPAAPPRPRRRASAASCCARRPSPSRPPRPSAWSCAPAPARPARHRLAGPLARSIGPPAFHRRRSARAEPHPPTNSHWNGTTMHTPFRKDAAPDAENPLPVVPVSRHGAAAAAAAGTVVAFPAQARQRRRWSSAARRTTPSASPRWTSEAARLRLKPGMGIADARAMYPAIEIVEADPEADRRLLEALADWCDRYTPLVALDGADGLFLDITGCAHLFGGEEAMLDDHAGPLLRPGLSTRAPGSPRRRAPPGRRRAFPHGTVILAGGDEEAFLAPSAARRPAARAEGTIAQPRKRRPAHGRRSVMAAPRAPLARRFGAILLLRLDQALGEIEEVDLAAPARAAAFGRAASRRARSASSRTSSGWSCCWPPSLKQDLERRGEGARLLRAAAVPGRRRRLAASRPAPRGRCASPRPIRQAVPRKADGARRRARRRLRFRSRSSRGLRDGAPSRPRRPISAARIKAAARTSRFSPTACAPASATRRILTPLLVESHLPERAASLVPGHAEPVRKARCRPEGIRRTVSVAARARAAAPAVFAAPSRSRCRRRKCRKGRRCDFRWRRAMHQVARAEGPERIAPEWWRIRTRRSGGTTRKKRAKQEQAEREACGRTARMTRDYFRVEDADGHRYWLYREGLYGPATSPRWFMHGLFA